MSTTAILLTCYNRPRLVADAIASVLEQEGDWRLYILDDGSNEETRAAIRTALQGVPSDVGKLSLADLTSAMRAGNVCTVEDGALISEEGVPLGRYGRWPRVVWWQGVDRIMWERRATIPYSYTANLAMNFLLSGEDYILHLCDDDYLLPGAIAGLAGFLDAHMGYAVCYGRLRAVEYGADGAFNRWRGSGLAQAGRTWQPPTGRREFSEQHGNGRTYYADGVLDPETGLDYVEEAYWKPGPLAYGKPFRIDHNQAMYRATLLEAPDWPHNWRYTEYWGEALSYGVGDASFFDRLARFGPFQGADVWVATKRYHVRSMGRGLDTVRE